MMPLDDARLARAFQCAEQSIGLSDPNPRVGCVIGSQDGTILAEGWTQAAGQAHAEVAALADARRRGIDVKAATAWVTLEPCSHHGRTPPCCEALIEAGIARVVVAALDPNPEVHGRGMARLRHAGLQVDLAGDAQAERCRELNIGFFSRMTRGRPWVRMKVACSLDGRVSLPDGRSRWITGTEARTDGHRWRKRAGAVVTGIGTVLADDPRLDVRLVDTSLQPLRVILDSSARLPPSAAILQPPGQVLWVHGDDVMPPPTVQRSEIERCALTRTGARIDPQDVIALLAGRAINEVHVEAGPVLNATLLDADLVDELLMYQAPMLIGPGRPIAYLAVLPELDAAQRFRVVDSTLVGQDLRLLVRRAIDSACG